MHARNHSHTSSGRAAEPFLLIPPLIQVQNGE
jgi:hypothetical protein